LRVWLKRGLWTCTLIHYHGRTTRRKSGGACSNMVWWERGSQMSIKRGTACPCGWQHAATSSRAAQALQLREHVLWTCTGALAIGRTIQRNGPRGGAAAASACVSARACVAARAAMPISKEESVVCCVPSCPDCQPC